MQKSQQGELRVTIAFNEALGLCAIGVCESVPGGNFGRVGLLKIIRTNNKVEEVTKTLPKALQLR